jgi:hypothetical protein
LIDEFILFNAFLSPFRIEDDLRLAALHPRLWNGNEIGTDAASIDDLVGDAFVGESKMAAGLLKGEFKIGFSITTGGIDCPMAKCVRQGPLTKYSMP